MMGTGLSSKPVTEYTVQTITKCEEQTACAFHNYGAIKSIWNSLHCAKIYVLCEGSSNQNPQIEFCSFIMR